MLKIFGTSSDFLCLFLKILKSEFLFFMILRGQFDFLRYFEKLRENSRRQTIICQHRFCNIIICHFDHKLKYLFI